MRDSERILDAVVTHSDSDQIRRTLYTIYTLMFCPLAAGGSAVERLILLAVTHLSVVSGSL